MILIRVRTDSPITTCGLVHALGPKEWHTAPFCPVCDGPLTTSPYTHVLVGIDPKERKRRDGGSEWIGGSAVHAACAGLKTNETNPS